MVKIHQDKIVNPEPNCLESDDDFNDGHWFEAMDRCNTINVMIEELLESHPAVFKVDGGPKLVDGAINSIGLLYRMLADARENHTQNLDKHVTKE